MVKLLPYFFLLLLCCPAAILPQTNDLSGREGELEQLKSEIKDLEAQLKAKTKKEKQSLESLQLYTKQSTFLNKLINGIRREESLKEKEIKLTRGEIASIEKEIKNIRELYAKYVVYLYKYSRTDKLSFLVDARSLNQAYLRSRYLNRLTQRNQANLKKLENSRNELITLNRNLQTELEQKRRLEEQKREEEVTLSEKITERRTLVKQLKNNNEALKKEIELKRQSEQEIRNLIARLVEEERRKAEERRLAEELRKQKELAETKTTPGKDKKPEQLPEVTPPLAPITDFSTSALIKGKLLWPINNGKIIRKFGENKNQKLNTVTLNYGVDIKAGKDLDVKAVSGGIVSSVTWLPGYGSIIIITHKDNFRTVYGHLGNILVGEGAQVTPGKVIGTVADGLEGTILHFEIWSERVNQNPELWLVKK